MQDVSGTGARSALRQVAAWVPPVARFGYAAKGVVYLLVGWIAFDAAMASGDPEGSSGALASLADESGGRMMLKVIAIGLFAHVAWRVVQALLDPEHHHRGEAKQVAMRVFYAISAVVYGSLAVTAWQLSRGSGGNGDDGHEVWVARLLEQPLGTWLVMLAGLGVIAYGLHQLRKAWRGDVNRRLSTGDQHVSRGVRVLGRLGTAARGFVLLPLGWFVFNAGRHYRADIAADTGEVLKMLGEGWLLAAVAVGLFAYGLHQVAKAMYRRIGAPRTG